jgi:hypothetical protein
MTVLRVAVLVEEQTPAHWRAGISDALKASLSLPYELDVYCVSHSASAQSVFSGALANAMLSVDSLFRRLGRWASRSGSNLSIAAARGQQVERESSITSTKFMATRKVRIADVELGGFDLIISTLSGTRGLLSCSARSTGMVLWAEWNGRVLGSSAYGFFSALAKSALTINVEVHVAPAGLPHHVLMRSQCAIRSVSPSLNEELLAARVSDLLAVCAESLQTQKRNDEIAPLSEVTISSTADAKLDVRTLLLVATNRVSASWSRSSRRPQWGLGYRRTSTEAAEESFRQIPQSELLIPPPDRAWADPFPVYHEGCDLVFFEQEVATDGKGHIAMAELLRDGSLGQVTRVLESPWHMSYPCVFRSDGEWFMVPESRAAGRVALYRATDFPFKWEHERDLVSGRNLADATLFQREGRWWLLACRVGAGQSTNEDLVGFSAPSLTGQWEPISRMPLISDATAGRPAGHLIEGTSGLLRPAQDGAKWYGYGLALRMVTRITANSFSEHDILRVSPTWLPELRGVHTFNRSTTITFIDVLRSRM